MSERVVGGEGHILAPAASRGVRVRAGQHPGALHTRLCAVAREAASAGSSDDSLGRSRTCFVQGRFCSEAKTVFANDLSDTGSPWGTMIYAVNSSQVGTVRNTVS